MTDRDIRDAERIVLHCSGCGQPVTVTRGRLIEAIFFLRCRAAPPAPRGGTAA